MERGDSKTDTTNDGHHMVSQVMSSMEMEGRRTGATKGRRKSRRASAMLEEKASILEKLKDRLFLLEKRKTTNLPVCSRCAQKVDV